MAEESFECPVCQRSFSSEQALGDHRRDTGHVPGARDGDGGIPLPSASTVGKWAVGVLVAGAILYPLFNPQFGDPRYPTTDSDWHADYSVVVCGEEQPSFPDFGGGIHTDGDGRIHIAPGTPGQAGRAANLDAFFVNAGGRLTRDYLGLPAGGTWASGDACPSGATAHLGVFVDGERLEDPASYVPRDGESVRVVFGPEVDPLPDSAAAAGASPSGS